MKNFESISESTEIHRLLQQSLQKAADKIDEGIVVVDMDGVIRYYNRWQLETDGIMSPSDIVGKRVYDNKLITKETSVLYNTIQTGKETLDFEQHYINYNNQYVKLHASAYPIKSKGKLLGALGVYKNLEPHLNLARKVVTPSVKRDLIHDSGSDKETLYRFNDLIGNDKQFLQQIDIAKIAAKGDSSTLIYGETGTGKELFAQSIHTASNRHNGPFVAINCSAVPENLFEALLFGTKKSAFTGAVDRKGLLEEAESGTLFLDEINTMPILLQSKLLRAIEEQKILKVGETKEIRIDIRIISSCNIDPQIAINQNTLRRDLFYRLAVFIIHLPSIRSRKEDILILTNHFVKQYSLKLGKEVLQIGDDLLEKILTCQWPGNIRQLKHYIESAISIAPKGTKVLNHSYLPNYFNLFSSDDHQVQKINPAGNNQSNKSIDGSHVFDKIRENEQQAIVNALLEENGNISKAAKKINISRRTFYNRMRKYGIQSKRA